MILYVSHKDENYINIVKEESKHYRTIRAVEKLFITTRKSFFLNNSFDSTIWYSEIHQEFKNLLYKDINSLDFLNSLLDIYKRLFVRSKHYQRPEHDIKVIPISAAKNLF